MKNLGKIIGWNLSILLVYSVLVRLTNRGYSGNSGGLNVLIYSAMLIAFHVFMNFGLALNSYSSGDKQTGNSFMLSMVIVLIVGFGTCLGNANI